MEINRSLIFTESYDSPNDFSLPSDAVILYELTDETRTRHSEKFADHQFAYRIESKGLSSFLLSKKGDTSVEIQARSRLALATLISAFGSRPVYLDITGM